MNGRQHEDSANAPERANETLGELEGMMGYSSGDLAEPGPERHTHGGGEFQVSRENGVRWVKGEDDPKRVCDELRALAVVRDAGLHDWGLLLEYRDLDGNQRRKVMPLDAPLRDPGEAVCSLARAGFRVEPGQSRKAGEYLQVLNPRARGRTVQQLGWHGSSYLTSEETFSLPGSEHVYLAEGVSTGGYGRRGTAESWRGNVAALASGNTRLVFAICCGFAAPLLELAGVESGGFHFMGGSSLGKTTALWLAASPWGAPERYIRPWRATANGLEGVAALHNDGLLCLDELSQCDPKQAGETGYMLANGKGKARASRSGGARECVSWRLLFLSTGEVSLDTLLESAGKRANAGQEVRLATVPADAGAQLGMFEALHGRESASAFADALKAACGAHHGEAGRVFLRRLVEDHAEAGKAISRDVESFVREVVPKGASGQVYRVARRFGIVAAAGELATQYGVTGWSAGEADRCARACFVAWLEGFGAGSHEDKAVVERVVDYITRHGASRFQNLDAESESVRDRAGFWKNDGATRIYHFLPGAFREMVAGFNPTVAGRALQARGMLQRGDKLQRKVRLPGLGPQWVYSVTIPEEVQP